MKKWETVEYVIFIHKHRWNARGKDVRMLGSSYISTGCYVWLSFSFL